MPELSQRAKTVEAIAKSSIHQSLMTPTSHVAISRFRASTLNDPAVAFEHLLIVLQPLINQDIKEVLNKYRDTYFSVALNNAKANLGADKVSDDLLDDVCVSILENAKMIFNSKSSKSSKNGKKSKSRKNLKKRPSSEAFPLKEDNLAEPKKPNVPVGCSGSNSSVSSNIPKVVKPNTDLILMSKYGRPVRREGPKWEGSRLTESSLFILGSRANKALGYGQTRGRLYIKHPELFKYSGDQEDKEWLAKNQVMSTTGGKAYLMVLDDIIELSKTPDYASHPRQQPNELIGFSVPHFMIEKMKRFMEFVKTDPNLPDNQLLAKSEEQLALWEEERKRFIKCPKPVPSGSNSFHDNGTEAEALYVQEILEDLKKKAPAVGATGNEDELGFLNSMTLCTLVRELEMETTKNGSEHLGILSLADDCAESPFPELPEEIDEEGS